MPEELVYWRREHPEYNEVEIYIEGPEGRLHAYCPPGWETTMRKMFERGMGVTLPQPDTRGPREYRV